MVRIIPVLALVLGLTAQEDEAARQARRDFEKVVRVEFPRDGYQFTRAEAARGITLRYKVIVERDQAGVIALPSGPSFHEPAGPSGLHPREQIAGKGQRYCLIDFGLAAPPREVVRTLKKGTYEHSFVWDGRNWTGPSDFGNPRGKPFPAGTYEVTVTVRGKLVTDKGRIPYEIPWKTKLILK